MMSAFCLVALAGLTVYVVLVRWYEWTWRERGARINRHGKVG